ncbi:membrane-bound serine protease (ClpP class) [Marininema mesophilum]|uniref:Membrane-bound serine protease (ClpP class) n=1 Tax=Marininema mesophilum TaxID=1048340 RepID=A0A1H2R543_9BACL|nr:NfeD family protein [Marininema mesophilum]SDW14582.1 membrane-bound serine protease (ClpP class) [Marininema mesophilum]
MNRWKESISAFYLLALLGTIGSLVVPFGYAAAESSAKVPDNSSFAEQLGEFVTNPYVVMLLLIFGLAGVFIELLTPGFGVAGGIGLISFGLYFFGNYIAGFAGYETLLFIVIGLLLMGIELVVPGGIFGILGFISFAAGVVYATYDTTVGLISLLLAMVIGGVIVAGAVKILGIRDTWRRFVLFSSQKNETGYVSQKERAQLTGRQGKTITPLRPSGTAEIDGVRQDVVSDGGFIASGEPVVVVGVEGMRVIVRKLLEEKEIQSDK